MKHSPHIIFCLQTRWPCCRRLYTRFHHWIQGLLLLGSFFLPPNNFANKPSRLHS